MKKSKYFTVPIVVAAMVANMSIFSNYAQAVLTTIDVTPLNPNVAVGATQQFTATTLDQNGVATADVVTWSVTDPTIGTIDAASGLFTALAPGTTAINATSGLIIGTTTVTVYTPALTTINVTPPNLTVAAGVTQQFTAATLDQNGNPIAAVVTWSSSDPTIASIDPATGLLTAVANGAVTVTATSGLVTGTAAVTVYTPALTTINVTPVTPTLALGATQQFAAATLDQAGLPFVAAVTWSSSDPTVGTIDATTGLLTTVGGGTTTVTATSGLITGSTLVTVTAPVLTTINVTPATPTVVIGATQQFTAATLDQSGNPIAAVVTWSSSDPLVGTIDATTGLFTAVSGGTTTITATSGLVTGTTLVTVSAVLPVLTTINVTPANPTVTVGATQQFAAATLDQFSNPISATVTWSSSDPSIGTIDSSGLFSALAVGTTTVSATSGTVTGSTVVTVSLTAPAPAAVTNNNDHNNDDDEEDLPSKPTIKNKFTKTPTSITFPVKFERREGNRVTITVSVQNFLTGETFQRVIKTRIRRDDGKKKITVDGLTPNTLYKFKVKMKKSGTAGKAHYSKPRKATTTTA